MNIIELITALSKSHGDLLEEAKDTLECVGDCDHSVGICCCGLKHRIEEAERLQSLLENRLKTMRPKPEADWPSDLEREQMAYGIHHQTSQ